MSKLILPINPSLFKRRVGMSLLFDYNFELSPTSPLRRERLIFKNT